MASWKKILAFDTSPTVENSFVTINSDDSVQVIRFGGLPPITPGSGEDVANVLASNPTNFLFAVDDFAENDHKKVTLDDIAGALAAGLVDGLPTGGTAYYTGETSGLPADLNNDGQVSTADLLEFLTAFGEVGDGSDTSVRLTTTASLSLDDTNEGPDNADTLTFTTSDSAISTGTAALTVDGTNNKLVFYNDGTASGLPAQYFFDGNPNRKYKFHTTSGGTNPFSVTLNVSSARISIRARIESFDAETSGNSVGVRYEPLAYYTEADDAAQYDVNFINGAEFIIHEGSFNSLLDGDAKRVEISFEGYTDNGEACSVQINDLDVTIMKS